MRSLPAACLSICLVAAASVPTPLQYTRSVLEQAQAVVAGSQPHDQKLAALAALFRNFLDTDEMGKEAAGNRWYSFTPSQQKRFLILFRRLFERTYVDTLLLFEKPDFAYVGETPFHSEVRVDTKIITPHDEFAVAYQLRPDGDRWMATNVQVENVNLTANLANQLDHLLSRSSVDDVLDLMQRKYGDAAVKENHP
jgi:phospholipid transport system substrate-binding protein